MPNNKNKIYSKFNVGNSPKLNEEYKLFLSEEDLLNIKSTPAIDTKTSKLVRISESNYNKLKSLIDINNENTTTGKMTIPVLLNYLLDKELKKI